MGTGDFNADGLSDILFQNSSGQVVIWEMSGATVIARGSAGNPGPSWHVRGDSSSFFPGSADLLWQSDRPYIFLQNDDVGAFVWATDGSTVTGGDGPGNPGPSWHVKASGDFNADGNPDILWQNDSGEGAIWEMNGTTPSPPSPSPTPAPPGMREGLSSRNAAGPFLPLARRGRYAPTASTKLPQSHGIGSRRERRLEWNGSGQRSARVLLRVIRA